MTAFCILFDLDGTLVLTGGAGMRAFDRAFKEIYGTDGEIKSVNPAGKTDPAILDEVCRHFLDRRPTPEEREAVFARYVRYLEGEVRDAPGFQVMPGIKPLLEALSRDGRMFLGLGTGNIREGARIKLEPPGLWRYFRFGGFGSDAFDRPGLLARGLKEGRKLLGEGMDFEAVYVIGDTHHDITAGRAIGARTIGVATGPYSVEDLRRERPDRIYEDLSDYRAFLADLEPA